MLLINGDRLALRRLAGAGVVKLIPAPDGGPVVTLHIKSSSYEFPVYALPYLGHGLDPSLFNLTLLQRLESGGRLPVRLTFTGARHALPGITVTSSSGQTASGYLTAASARAFGLALYRQFRADHASAGHGTAALFSGVSIALAGAPAVAPIRPQFPMHTLTVTGTNEFRNPDNADAVFVLNADNPFVFGDPFEDINIFYHGVAKFSVPPGHYWAITDFVTFLKNSVTQRVVVAPQFTVDRNTELRLSARAASSEITVRTPRPSGDMSATWTVARTSPNGLSAIFSASSFGPLYISPTTTKPTAGTIQSYTFAQLNSAARFKGTPYAYSLDFRGPLGVIPRQHFAATPASLATVHDRYYNGSPGFGFWDTLGGYLPQLEGFIFFGGNAPEVRMPGLQTQYMTGSNSILWLTDFFADNGASQGDSPFVLLPGQQLTENWNQYPLHPQPDAQLISHGLLAQFASQLPSAFRSGNELWLAPNPFSDNQLGHYAESDFGAGYTVTQNGRQIAGGGFGPGDVLRVKIKPMPSVISFTLTAQQPDPLFVLSPGTTTTWVMHTAPAPHAVVPLTWFCLRGNYFFTQNCKVQPMLTLNYEVSGLGLDGVVPPGPEQVDVTVGHIALAAAAAIVHASARVSYDNGRFWEPVTLTRAGAGRYRVSFTAPAGVDVTLRFSATDADGNSITETIINGYSVGL